MNDKIYLHTINNYVSDYYKPKRQKFILESILRSGEVLSRRLQGDLSDNTNFSGLDYISLIDYEKRFISNKECKYYNSYYSYALNGLSLTFPKNKLEVIEPILIGVCSRNYSDFDLMRQLGLSKTDRYSDLPDEVQVKNSISLEHMNGILFPVENYLSSRILTSRKTMIDLMKKELESIHELINKYGYDVKIYDVESLIELNDEGIKELTLK